MFLKEDNKLFEVFLSIKEKYKLEIVDSHIHPLDVLGIHKNNSVGEKKIYHLKPSLLEYLEHGRLSLFFLKLLFQYQPSLIQETILKTYQRAGKKQLLYELNRAGIDKGILLPVLPYVSADEISSAYEGEKFVCLGSVDVCRITPEEVERIILEQINKFNIKGIKLHPNIQGFYPQPSFNNRNVAESLKKIYKVAEENRLYLLFHAGYSYLFDKDGQGRKIEYAKLENFCNHEGKSELFGKYNIPIILAHMGSYQVAYPNFQLLQAISQSYRNVYFDTTGISPKIISKAVEIIGSDRIIFGTDAFYNNIKHSLLLVLKALKDARTEESFEEKVVQVFSKNYQRL